MELSDWQTKKIGCVRLIMFLPIDWMKVPVAPDLLLLTTEFKEIFNLIV